MQINNLLEFFNKRLISDHQGEKIPCEESMEYAKNWLKEREQGVENIDAKQWYDEALKDRNLPSLYRNRLEHLTKDIRPLIAAVGRNGIEDAGEWKIGYPGMIDLDDDSDDDGRTKQKIFPTKQDAVSWIENRIQEYYGRESWIHEIDIIDRDVPYESYEDGKLYDIGFSDMYVTWEDIFQRPDTDMFVIRSHVANFEELVPKTHVLETYERAIQETIKEYKIQFVMHRRVKPKGDPVWGNWWIRVSNF